MWPKTSVCRNFFPLQTAKVTYFQIKIQLSGISAYPDGSPSQLIRKSGVLLYFNSSDQFFLKSNSRSDGQYNAFLLCILKFIHILSINELRLPPLFKWDLLGCLRRIFEVTSQMFHDNPSGPIFKHEKKFYLKCLILEDGTDRLSLNVGNYQPTLRNIP